ncbi:hypothetical protein AMS68_002775 [Peltaster fructicola]|uniref:AB hydrolase-1 domain-containing protein n=1 Tax=Peltaster fructicola TaxID=286661 RepID=A0A6H0XRI8_9PEZI|nr:hypothetical protein AMS68_002775 [Peltaster fructicola]
MEPAYSFTVPSIEDDTVLDCRIYHPGDLSARLPPQQHKLEALRGAVIAHPYSPLGGCYDDPIVLAVTEKLLQQGYIVATFNFRGAAGSAGSTSWSAKGEKEDFITLVGFIVRYMQSLAESNYTPGEDASPVHQAPRCPLRLLLAGYSYGSLILTRIPSLHNILQRFDNAAIGTSAAEVILRARRLAQETLRTAQELDTKNVRGRGSSTSSPSGRSRALSNTVRVGGEETQSSERRLSRGSRESRRGIDMVKKSAEAPHRIAMHFRRHSSSKSQEDVSEKSKDEKTPQLSTTALIKLRYLLISPLSPPLSYTLAPPSHIMQFFGQSSSVKDASTGFGMLEHDTLAIWGTNDGFSSSKKLTTWIERLQAAAPGLITGIDVDGAGHFWREHGVLKQLLEALASWTESHVV